MLTQQLWRATGSINRSFKFLIQSCP